MKVLLVTTWDIPCGIAEHSRLLKAAVEAADPSIEIDPLPLGIPPNPDWPAVYALCAAYDVVHLNYQAALHSQWTPERLLTLSLGGKPVLTTYHDTGVPNADQCKRIIEASAAAVVHEPFTDLPAEKTTYWRMGVPAAPANPLLLHVDRKDARDRLRWAGVRRYPSQPVLGTVGFPFPWKNYDRLAEITGANGWALLLIAPTATSEDVARWTAANPECLVYTDFLHPARVVRLLHGCDATAFAYVCHNAGQSGAILQGIAARKPVLAFHTCRQFRSLYLDPLGRETIDWIETFDDLAWKLRHVRIGRVDPGIVALAEQESWGKLGEKYAALYRSLV